MPNVDEDLNVFIKGLNDGINLKIQELETSLKKHEEGILQFGIRGNFEQVKGELWAYKEINKLLEQVL